MLRYTKLKEVEGHTCGVKPPTDTVKVYPYKGMCTDMVCVSQGGLTYRANLVPMCMIQQELKAGFGRG